MYTVNYTKFFEFGVDAGDAQFDVASYGYSETNLFIPIRFLGASYSRIRVRTFQTYFYAGFIYIIDTAELLEAANSSAVLIL